MFKNYIKTALRTLLNYKVFTAINILGLAIGISASLVIFLLVNYHFSFDRFEKDHNRIYRVVSDYSFSNEKFHNPGILSPMGPAIKKELTGIDELASFRIWNDSDVKITVPGESQSVPAVFKNQKEIVFADEDFFNIIGYQWIAGSAKTSLKEQYQIVLSEASAKLYFPKLLPGQVIGKELIFNDTIRTTVTGVIKNLADNTDFTFKTFVSRATLENPKLTPDDWTDWNSTIPASQLLIKLSAGTQPAQIEKSIYNLYRKFHKPDANDKVQRAFKLQPLSDIHFNATYGSYGLPVANKLTLYGLLAVSVFLLLLGCINFINLTTANASKRAKEIGIRKSMGGTKRQLVIQFLSETFLITLFSSILSVLLIPFLLKAFSEYIPEGLHFSSATQPGVIIFFLLLIISVTGLSGFYPAFILSGYKPVLALKNQEYSFKGKPGNALLRNSLNISQFIIAQFFIMTTLLVSQQISYTVNKDIGFKKDAIINFDVSFQEKVPSALMNKLKAIPGIEMVSLNNHPPSSTADRISLQKYKDGKKEIETQVFIKYADTNYLELYQMKLIAGSNLPFSDTLKGLIINETYAHILGFQNPHQAIGKNIEFRNKQVPIFGVVADFNQRSLHETIKPLTIASDRDQQFNFSVLLQRQGSENNSWKTTITNIEAAFKEVYPEDNFAYTFFDEDISKFYKAEQNMSGLLMWATGLSVFISCLGLLGLVIYTTTRRTKEIGIRKVLGATVFQIVSMITKDFLMLIMIAFVVAVPLAWMGMHQWLENFSYRIGISWWIFISGGLVMVFFALVTLSFQTIKAAIANPARSLLTE